MQIGTLFFICSSDGITGPLTQRLLAAFIEENVMPNEANIPSSHKTESNDGRSEHNRASNVPNGIEVERRLKKELLDLGLLDMNDFPKVNKYIGDFRNC